MTTEEALALAANAPGALLEYAQELRDCDVCIRNFDTGEFNPPGTITLKAISLETMADAVAHLLAEFSMLGTEAGGMETSGRLNSESVDRD